MAASQVPSDDSEYQNFIADENNEEGHQCLSKICWFLIQLYHYTIGSCCYTPLRWLYVTLFNGCCHCQNSSNHSSELVHEEMTNYDTLSNIMLPQDKQWKRLSQIAEADCRMKERLRHQFQDHIQKWRNMKHRRFPWKAVLHLLLVVFVTIQVS